MATRTLHPDRARQRELRREELLDAADRIVRAGGRDTSMDEIAAEAGITKPILYRHFGDKDGLHEALAERYVEELKEALLPAGKARGARERLAATIDAYLAYVEREPALPLPPGRRRALSHRRVDEPTSAEARGALRRHRHGKPQPGRDRSRRRRALGPRRLGLIREAGIWWLETRAMPPEAGRGAPDRRRLGGRRRLTENPTKIPLTLLPVTGCTHTEHGHQDL